MTEFDVSTDEGYQAALDLVSTQVRAVRLLPVAELLVQLGRVETLAVRSVRRVPPGTWRPRPPLLTPTPAPAWRGLPTMQGG